MKRLWFAIVFLVLAAVLCTGEQMYICDVYTQMNEKINAAETALTKNDKKEYIKKTDEIAELWDSKNDLLYAVSEHGVLDTLAVQIRSMPYGEGDETKELHSLKAQLFAYYENERISLSNLL
ncbi:MAG: DUF4363 family protein [Ruminococcaceae bacterium]|nr:DUF4363 family protein [Oscillospiraceae bacterium]